MTPNPKRREPTWRRRKWSRSQGQEVGAELNLSCYRDKYEYDNAANLNIQAKNHKTEWIVSKILLLRRKDNAMAIRIHQKDHPPCIKFIWCQNVDNDQESNEYIVEREVGKCVASLVEEIAFKKISELDETIGFDFLISKWFASLFKFKNNFFLDHSQKIPFF